MKTFPLFFRCILFLSLFLISAQGFSAPPSPSKLESYSFVFQPGKSNSEGYRESFLGRGTLHEVAASLSNLSAKEVVKILIPDSLTQEEEDKFFEEQMAFFESRGILRDHFEIVKIPVTKTIQDGEYQLAELEKSGALGEDKAAKNFASRLREKLADLSSWSSRFRNNWKNKTDYEKDQIVIAAIGGTRSLPGVIVFAADAGLNSLNIIRMTLSYAIDLFFSTHAQKIAKFPERFSIPGLGEWFNKNNRLKQFLFGYSLSLGIPITFLTLGYYAKGGDLSGLQDPLGMMFLMGFAKTQALNSFMGMLGTRSIRGLTEKGYFSGRKEQMAYIFFSLLSVAQSLSIGTANMLVYQGVLVFKSLAQGTLYLVNWRLKNKSTRYTLFHPAIGQRDQKSYLYQRGLEDLKEVGLNGLGDNSFGILRCQPLF